MSNTNEQSNSQLNNPLNTLSNENITSGSSSESLPLTTNGSSSESLPLTTNGSSSESLPLTTNGSSSESKSKSKPVKSKPVKSTRLGIKRALRKKSEKVFQPLKKPALKRLARRGGVTRISENVYGKVVDLSRSFLKHFLRQVIQHTKDDDRHTIMIGDVLAVVKSTPPYF